MSLGILSESLVVEQGDRSSTSQEASNTEPLFHQAIYFSGSPVTMPAKTPIEIKKIQDLGWVGAPCTSAAMVPFDKPSMTIHKTSKKPHTPIKRVIYSSATSDGGISYKIITSNPSKKNHASTFSKVAHEHPSSQNNNAENLLELYKITPTTSDADALERICQFESDIGFFMPSLSQAQASQASKTYLQLWDLKNPFMGLLGQHRKATHTWDICRSLGRV